MAKFNDRKWRRQLFEKSDVWKVFDAKQKLYSLLMDIEYDLKMITQELKQTHRDMEQEAEPEGGPKATRYGKAIEKLEKSYKQKKAEFKKQMAKLDRLEQF
jgi:predicted patatin/cPLA2 family phospholipase